jgi:hypothetical protein
MPIVEGALTDTANVSLASVGELSSIVSDTASISPSSVGDLSSALSDALSITPDLSLTLHLTQDEEVRISLVQVLSRIFSVEMQQSFRTTGVLSLIDHVLASDSVDISEDAAGILAALLIDRVGVSLVAALKLAIGETYEESSVLSDNVARALAASVTNGVTLSSSTLAHLYPTAAILESASVQDTLAPTFSLVVVSEDGLDISDDQILNFVFSSEVTDEVEISAAFSAGDNLVAWAVNTRTGSVSSYLNFSFNSFGYMGNRYYAASKDGLYELTGDDDDSTDIVATIRSGFHQFGGPYLTSLDAAYLGVRGDGNYVLKIITADGQTYTYSVSAQSMRTAKIKLGRGMSSRYVSFELVSSGQDFDLESIEFKPVVLSRRV